LLHTLLLCAALCATARQQPDSIREWIAKALSTVSTAQTARERQLQFRRAQDLAGAYAEAWSDSFLVAQVNRFTTWTPAERRSHVMADSLRLAGNAAMGSAGIPAAMRLWRESVARAQPIGDDAVVAPTTLSIGAGFFRAGRLDSATVYVSRAQALADRIKDARTSGNATGIAASIAKSRGDLATAAALYRKASTIRLRSGDTRGIAADENNLGLIAQEKGDLAAAARAFDRALGINRRDGRKALVALNLNNLAGIASTLGEYARADSLYRQALAIDRETGSEAESGFVLHDLGKLLIRRGNYRGAETALRSALRIHEKSGATADAIAVRVDLAALESATGNAEAALALLRQSENAAASTTDAALRASIAMARADIATQFGTFAEADADYLRAAQLYAAGRQPTGQAQALQGHAVLLHLRGDPAGALRILEQVERTQRNAGDQRSAAITGLVKADIQRLGGEFGGADRTLAAAQEVFRRLGDPVGEAASLSARGDVAASRSSYTTAESFYRNGLSKLGNRHAPDISWRLHEGLGNVLRMRGSLNDAASELRTAIAEVEKTAVRLRLDERRSGYLADKWSAYTQLAMIEKSRGRAGDAFAVSERMRARQMIDMLARGQIRTPPRASMREQDLRRRIDELTRRLEASQPSPADTREPIALSADATRRQLDGAQKEYARLIAQLRESDPSYARLVSGETLSSRAVSSRLASDEVLLEYLLGDSTSVVFAVTRGAVTAIDLHASRQQISDLVEFARRTMDKPDKMSAAQLWRVPLRRLHTMLIGPVERSGVLSGKKSLIIVPHNELHFLSYGALIAPNTKDRFLIEQFEISYAPSATTWVRLGERQLRQPSDNVLALAPRVDRLPASRDEVLSIQKLYGRRASVFTGRDASEQTLRARLPNTGTLHLATFGVLNKHNPLFSFVELAPSAGNDGRLEVNEVFGLGLSGQLVVLSACQTALGSGATADVPAGDDWVGLVQAFLQGGARGVLASLWPVDDRATAQLMENFHRRLAAGVPAQRALADAQRTLLRDSKRASPFYWAGFVLNGTTGTQNQPRIAMR
jgi:CHAT domain-containing protein/Tfp pilus assembly protein PilF